MQTLTLRTLGECAIQVGDTTVSPSAPHLFAVLLYLGVERCRDIPRSALIEMLFPDQSPSAATHNLRQLLYRVRKLGLELGSSAATVRLDGGAVEDVVEQRLGRPYHESAKAPAASCELLPGYQPPTRPFSQWLECYRDSVHRALVRKLAEELQTARRGANWSTVDSFASMLLTLDPFNETATLCLAESLARSGSKQRAVSMLQRFEDEVGSPTSGLALPSRLLKRRISESTLDERGPSVEAPLVGRTREMEVLSDSWTRARIGRCTVVALTGEKSIGKSRLVSEFLSIVRLDASGASVFSRRRFADRDRPLSLFADICKQLVGMPGAAGCAPHGLSFLSRLTTAPDGFESLRAEQLEVQFTLGNVRRAIIELIECVAHERPLILAIDDSRFLDEASRAILRDVQHDIPTSRLLILASGESDEAAWKEAQHVRLAALDHVALTEVALHAVARHQWPLDDELRRWCVEMASGNPGYLELLLQSARSTSMRQLPRDLIALVEERIAALSPHARQALQAIALFGAPCDGALIERLCGLGPRELLEALQELEAGSTIVAGSDGVACRSALIEECTKAATPSSVACVMHARAARNLERQSRESPPSQHVAWKIAAHWLDAGRCERARHWQRVCWRQSIAIGQPKVAADTIRDALNQRSSAQERAPLLDDFASALFAAGDMFGVQEALRERDSLCTQLGEGPDVRERIAFDAAEATLLNKSDPLPLREPLREFLQSRRLDTRRRIRAARTLMILADHELDETLAAEVCRINSDFTPPDLPSELLHGHTGLIFHSVFGDFSNARLQIDHLSHLTKTAGTSWESIATRSNVAFARALVEPQINDLSDLESSFFEARSASMYPLAISIAGRIGCFLLDLGEIDEAAKWIKDATDLTRQPGTKRLATDYTSCCFDLALITGDLHLARRHVETLRTHAPCFGTGTFRNFWNLSRIRLQLASSSEAIQADDLNGLLECHARARQFGRHDDFAEALWSALCSVGKRTSASSMLREYLTTHRRERRPCGYWFQRQTSSDPVWRQIRLSRDGGYIQVTRVRADTGE